MPKYHTIILAAGSNTRLLGTVPSYQKPFIVINGKPLILDLIQARQSDLITIVASPHNVASLCDLLNHADILDEIHRIIVQPVPRGPGDAIIKAWGEFDLPTMILCADNIIPTSAWDFFSRVIVDDGDGVMTISPDVDPQSVFTYGEPDMDKWEAGCVKIIDTYEDQQRDKFDLAWVGPLIFGTAAMFSLYNNLRNELFVAGQELKIGHLIAKSCHELWAYKSNCVDVGNKIMLEQST